jgi:hypothetical protein
MTAPSVFVACDSGRLISIVALLLISLQDRRWP